MVTILRTITRMVRCPVFGRIFLRTVIFIYKYARLRSKGFLSMALRCIYRVVIRLITRQTCVRKRGNFVRFLFVITCLYNGGLRIKGKTKMIGFSNINVRTSGLCPSYGRKRVKISRCYAVDLFTHTRTIIVTRGCRVKCLRFIRGIPLPGRLIYCARIASISTVGSRVCIIPLIRITCGIINLIVPTLKVARYCRPSYYLILTILLCLNGIINVSVNFATSICVMEIVVCRITTNCGRT